MAFSACRIRELSRGEETADATPRVEVAESTEERKRFAGGASSISHSTDLDCADVSASKRTRLDKVLIGLGISVLSGLWTADILSSGTGTIDIAS